MSGVAIYMEGGGSGRAGKAALRAGMDTLLEPLKQAARNKSMRWKLVCCGPRDEAFRSLRNAVRNADGAIVLLLVDAEEPVAKGPCEHLQARDKWDMTAVDAQCVHLMVQTMEAWIVADADALRRYYCKGFNAGVLPKAVDLESVAKREVEDCLRRATERTGKGRYQKIKHASDLLQRVDAEKVQARCRHCRRLFHELGRMIDAAQGKAVAG